jgi:hypothetical protein
MGTKSVGTVYRYSTPIFSMLNQLYLQYCKGPANDKFRVLRPVSADETVPDGFGELCDMAAKGVPPQAVGMPSPAVLVLDLPLMSDFMKDYYNHIHVDPETGSEVATEDQLSASSINAVASAMTHLHSVHGVLRTEKFAKFLTDATHSAFKRQKMI